MTSDQPAFEHARSSQEAATWGSPDIEAVFRQQYGRAVAVLIRQLGDITAAEDAVQDAFAEALHRWPAAGVPASPAGWIITTARNRAIHRHRREASRDQRQAEAAMLNAPDRHERDRRRQSLHGHAGDHVGLEELEWA